MAVVCLSIQPLISPEGGGRFVLALLLIGLSLGSFGIAAVAWSRPRPAVFAVTSRPPAFRTLPHSGNVYLALGMIFLAAAGIARRLRPEQPRDGGSSDLARGVLVVLALAYAVVVWRNLMGVQLGPDSVVTRGPFGTLTVPWDALAPGYPLARRRPPHT